MGAVRTDKADQPQLTPVLRTDVGRLRKAERLASGGFRVPAAVSREGILEYLQPDGSVIRELVPSETLSDPAALESLRDAPVTVGHPDGGKRLVSPETYRRDAVGHVSGPANVEADHLVASLAILDAEAIQMVDTGELEEISAGYVAMVDATPGEWNGERYDQVQRSRKYNHVALLPDGGGRAGDSVALRLDGAGVQVRAQQPQTRIDSMKTERIDGVDYEVGTDAWQAAKRHVAKISELQTRADEGEEEVEKKDAELEELKAERDDMKTKLDELEQKIADMEDPEAMDERADARRVLVDQAKDILGDKAELRGKSDLDIMRAVVEQATPEVKLDGLSDERIRGRFEGVVATFDGRSSRRSTRDDGRDPLAEARGRTAARPTTDSLDDGDDFPPPPPPSNRYLRS